MLFSAQEVLYWFRVIHFHITMQSNQSNCNSIVLLRCDFASIFITPPSWQTARSTVAVVQLVVSIDFKVYVLSDKQLSLLYDWHLLNARQAKYLFSAILVGTNRDYDVIHTLCPKIMIIWNFFSYVFWQWDQYHLEIQSHLFVRTPINRNPRYPKQIAKNRFSPTHFTSLIRKPRCPTPARNLGTDMSYQ